MLGIVYLVIVIVVFCLGCESVLFVKVCMVDGLCL